MQEAVSGNKCLVVFFQYVYRKIHITENIFLEYIDFFFWKRPNFIKPNILSICFSKEKSKPLKVVF